MKKLTEDPKITEFSKACDTNGHRCVGMQMAIAADVKSGIQNGIMINMATMKTREVITHRAILNGETRQITFNYCPFCRGKLNRSKQTTPKQKARVH